MGSVKSTHCRARQGEQGRKYVRRKWNAHSMFERQIIIEYFDNLRKRLEHAFIYGSGRECPIGMINYAENMEEQT